MSRGTSRGGRRGSFAFGVPLNDVAPTAPVTPTPAAPQTMNTGTPGGFEGFFGAGASKGGSNSFSSNTFAPSLQVAPVQSRASKAPTLATMLPPADHIPAASMLNTEAPTTTPSTSSIKGQVVTPSQNTTFQTESEIVRGAKRPKIDYSDDQLTIYVGTENEKFVIHKEALCARSEYFARMCAGEWQENQENILYLSDFEAATFVTYAHWVYIGSIAFDMDFPLPQSAVWLQFSKLWVLGDYLSDSASCNTLLDRRTARVTAFPVVMHINDTTLTYVFEHSPAGCVLRQFFIDILLSTVDKQHFENYCASYPVELLRGIVSGYACKITARSPLLPIAPKCKYHIHKEGKTTCT